MGNTRHLMGHNGAKWAPYCLLCCLALTCGCKSMERAVRHEWERKVAEVVHEEVPVIVRQSIGDLLLQLAPWALGPLGLGGGAILMARKRKIGNIK